jgi:GNAT superfamily N-acetyltransferase
MKPAAEGRDRENGTQKPEPQSKMSVVRFLWECGQATPSPAPAATVAIRRADLDDGGDRAAIAALVRGARWPSAAPNADGFLGELAGRAGREITVWLARGHRPDVAGDSGAARTVGLVSLGRTRGGWSIPWLLVHPDARRHGVGRRLVAQAVEHARALGAGQVTAESLASWPEAVAFWQAVGFARRPAADDLL